MTKTVPAYRRVAGLTALPNPKPALLYALASPSNSRFHYVYVMLSEDRLHRYVGLTRDLADRLKKHNSGCVLHTVKHRPWVIETAVAFRDRDKAAAYERYLKSHAGREYAKRHF